MSEQDSLLRQELLGGERFPDYNHLAYKTEVRVGLPTEDQLLAVKFRDESLRDGLGPCPRQPNGKEKAGFIEAVSRLGVDYVTVGIYSDSAVDEETLDIVSWMATETPGIKPVILARSHKRDVDFLIEAEERNSGVVGVIFQDLSRPRRLVQKWGEFGDLLERLCGNISRAVSAGVEVIGFTENLSITGEDHVRAYVRGVCEAGADHVGIADTAGRLIPHGAALLTRIVKEEVDDYLDSDSGGRDVGIVFHGHDDLGVAGANAMAALAEGATMIDVVVNGIGERIGNTDMFVMMALIETQLRAATNGSGYEQRFDLRKAKSLSGMYELMTGVRPGENRPIVGERRVTTSFGIHADYYLAVEQRVAELLEQGQSSELVENFRHEMWRLYSAMSPADLVEFDPKPDIRVSPFSGAANVILWAYYQGLVRDVRFLNKTDLIVQQILERAKSSQGELSNNVMRGMWMQYYPEGFLK